MIENTLETTSKSTAERRKWNVFMAVSCWKEGRWEF
jgi:hypothetical protein